MWCTHIHQGRHLVEGSLGCASRRRPYGAWHAVPSPPGMAAAQVVRRGSEQHAAKRCHALPVVSWSMRDQMLEAEWARPISTTSFAVAWMSRFSNPKRPSCHPCVVWIPCDHIVIGTVSRIADLKGHDDLLHAMAPLMQRDERLPVAVGGGWLEKEARLALARKNLDSPIGLL